MPVQDGAIIKKQFHTYSPYTSSYGANDEVRIAIQSQDLYVLPSESYILMEVEVTRKTDDTHAGTAGTWGNNPESYLFSEMRYEINNIEIDRIKNPGLTSNLKRYASCPTDYRRLIDQSTRNIRKAITESTHQFMIPLRDVFGFCDDYQKIIMNAKHELILVVNRESIYSYVAATAAFNMKISKIQWKVPHVQLADQAKLQMLRYLERKQIVGVPYRSWELFEMPELPTTNKHIWTVKSTSQICKPRFVLVAFQTNKKQVTAESYTYDNCNIRSIKLYLNNEYFPYDNMECDFPNDRFIEQFRAFCSIQKSYYPAEEDNPYQYTYGDFKLYPIFAFDCSRTDESLLGGAVDIRLEIDARANFPANTSASCLIIYDNYFEYSPFSSIVVKRT